jgi:hypothetical protein
MFRIRFSVVFLQGKLTASLFIEGKFTRRKVEPAFPPPCLACPPERWRSADHSERRRPQAVVPQLRDDGLKNLSTFFLLIQDSELCHQVVSACPPLHQNAKYSPP